MPEPKKTTTDHRFNAQTNSAIEGLRLERPASPAKPATPSAAERGPLPSSPEEPDLVSKLIHFIKAM